MNPGNIIAKAMAKETSNKKKWPEEKIEHLYDCVQENNYYSTIRSDFNLSCIRSYFFLDISVCEYWYLGNSSMTIITDNHYKCNIV